MESGQPLGILGDSVIVEGTSFSDFRISLFSPASYTSGEHADRGKWCKMQFLGSPKEGKQRASSSSVPQFPHVSPWGSLSGSRGEGGASAPWVRSPPGPAPVAVQKRSRAASAASSLHAVLAMQGAPAPAPAPGPSSPRGSPRGSPGLFRKLLVNQRIRLQRRFTVAHPLW